MHYTFTHLNAEPRPYIGDSRIYCVIGTVWEYELEVDLASIVSVTKSTVRLTAYHPASIMAL